MLYMSIYSSIQIDMHIIIRVQEHTYDIYINHFCDYAKEVTTIPDISIQTLHKKGIIEKEMLEMLVCICTVMLIYLWLKKLFQWLFWARFLTIIHDKLSNCPFSNCLAVSSCNAYWSASSIHINYERLADCKFL